MVYANQGPQHSGLNYSRSSSHSRSFEMTPEERKKAQEKAQQEKAQQEKYAADRAKGIFHPSDPQTKIVDISDPAQKRMSRVEQERRIKDGSLPPEIGDLHARAERLKDPSHQRPAVDMAGFKGPTTPQSETAKSVSSQTEVPKISQKPVIEAQPTLSKQNRRWQLSGTKAGEIITVTQDPQHPDQYSYEIQANGKVTKSGSMTAKDLAQVDLHGGDGRDVIALVGRMPEGMRVYGDGGKDSFLKTEGNEKLSIDGGKGVDQVFSTTVQATNHSGFEPTPETPVQQFRRELKENARSALQSNRDRLNAQEQRYRDPNPNSPQWKALWNAVSTRESFNRKTQSLRQEQEQVKAALAKPDALPKQSRLTVSDAEYRKDPAAQRYEQLNERRAAIPRELEQLNQAKLELKYEFPALSAVRQESKNTRENNQAILERIPQKFGEIRRSIDDLDHQIQDDPKVALRLDKVVQQTLTAGVSFERGNGMQEALQVQEWLEAEGNWKSAITGAGLLLTGATGVASMLNPEVGLLRWGTAALGVGTAATQLPDAMIGDRAAQAQRGGGERVTSLDPDTARANLVLGGANLLLAGLDAGLQPEVLRGLVKIPALAQVGVRLSRKNLSELMRAVRAKSVNNPEWMAIAQDLKKEIDDPSVWQQVQKTLMSIGARNRPPGAGGAQQLEAPGVGQVFDGQDFEPHQPMQIKSKDRGKGQESPKDMMPAERFAYSKDKYGQVRNWDEVEPLIGQTVNQQTKLPTGYRLLQKPGSKQLFILRETADDASFVPLMIEKGKIQAGKTRLSRDAMRANLKAVGINVPDGWQVNHLVPDAVAQSDPMIVEMLKRNIYDVDHVGNLLPMPGKAKMRQANSDLIGHQGSHGNYNDLVTEELKQRAKNLTRKYGSLDQVPDKELKQAVEGVEKRMRKGIINRSPQIPTRYDPETKTRVLSEGLSDPDFVA
jgi:hypothetical protein